MRITRRVVLAGAASVYAVSNLTGFGLLEEPDEPLFLGVPPGEAPGDKGYLHTKYHPKYQQLFGASGHCDCGDGDCRVTNWRITRLGSPRGFDVIVERKWVPLPADVWIPDPSKVKVPEELRNEWAHICAYQIGYYNPWIIACALINEKRA